MKYIAMVALFFLLPAGCASSSRNEETLGPYSCPESLIASVEGGSACPDVLVRALRNGPLRMRDLSPRAVANYLEAFAHERMLSLVPVEFCNEDAIVLAYETVFEDMENIFYNWEAYKTFLARVYRADLG